MQKIIKNIINNFKGPIMLRITLFSILAVLIIMSCSDDSSSPVQVATEEDQYDIYSLLLDSNYINYTKLAVYENNPVSYISEYDDYYKHIVQDFPTISKETVISFCNDVNQPGLIVSNKFTTKKEIVMVTSKDLESVSNDELKWDEDFKKLFPGTNGLIKLSKIGYNSNYTQALVYFSHQVSLLSTGEYFVLFEKINGKWIYKGCMDFWIV